MTNILALQQLPADSPEFAADHRATVITELVGTCQTVRIADTGDAVCPPPAAMITLGV